MAMRTMLFTARTKPIKTKYSYYRTLASPCSLVTRHSRQENSSQRKYHHNFSAAIVIRMLQGYGCCSTHIFAILEIGRRMSAGTAATLPMPPIWIETFTLHIIVVGRLFRWRCVENLFLEKFFVHCSAAPHFLLIAISRSRFPVSTWTH